LEKLDREKLLFEPGKGWSYSNIGFLLIRKEIEKVTNYDLNEIANELIFKKLDIKDVFSANSFQDMSNLSITTLNDYHPQWVYHGLFCGTLSSSTKILHSIMNGQILQRKPLTEMLIPFNLGGKVDGRPWLHPSYGLGIMIDESNNWKAYGHGGKGPNSSIAIFHFKGSEPRTIGVFHESENYNLLESQIINLSKMLELTLNEKYCRLPHYSLI
jgi:CubicO group peptidase (beta-lactamase class C family)